MKEFKVNDLLYTKDGRKIGNGIIIDVYNQTFIGSPMPILQVEVLTDYGNIITLQPDLFYKDFKKFFYSERGYADESHKNYNYKENHPELFI